METFDRAPRFSFPTKDEAEGFCKWLRGETYKYDVVIINDILRERKIPTVPEGWHCGYDRKIAKKLKPKKSGSFWLVELPIPGRMVRDENGYWKTVDISEDGGDG